MRKSEKAQRAFDIKQRVIGVLLSSGHPSEDIPDNEKERHLSIKLWRWHYSVRMPRALETDLLFGPAHFSGAFLKESVEQRGSWRMSRPTFTLDIWGPDLIKRQRTGNKVFSLSWNSEVFEAINFVRGPWEDAVLIGREVIAIQRGHRYSNKP